MVKRVCLLQRIIGFCILIIGLGVRADAATILVQDDISLSTIWTSNNVYNLQKQVYVLPGASLTIEAGTVVSSTAGLGGSLAVTRGARLFVNGTQDNPVIMTSTADVATWDADPNHPTGRDPRTGTWREGVNEWGNLTLMGNGLISASHFKGEEVMVSTDEDGMSGGNVISRTNTKVPDGMNRKQMEGLSGAFPGDPKVLYGGNDDDDDSGSISFLSIRYGGKVIGLGNELNGLSLGAIGRETEIDHVEIMNNVDDGIEIWGGTVNLSYINIWNIGDDSLDCDQGWRGKVQFGLIVQGFSTDADQGSGVGDNCVETDGAEDSDAQPVTTSTIYNLTAVGQPIDGDHATAWRDNARVQYRNCVFMDIGDEVVRFDGDDGDGANGYGYQGTLSWEETWTTDAGVHSTVNAATNAQVGDFNHPDTLYTVQTEGKLAEIKDSVFFRNLKAKAYVQDATVDFLNPANNNIIASATDMPIQSLERQAPVSRGGKTMLRVSNINPCAANDAVVSAELTKEDSFFIPVGYRGGFSPYYNWLAGWTAADAFGMTDTSRNTNPGSSGGDLNGDGIVNGIDLLMFTDIWRQ
jgi:hypothetical protein